MNKYIALTQKGKDFITLKCSGTGNSLLRGKSKDSITNPNKPNLYNPYGVLPFCDPPISKDKIWVSNATHNGKAITTNQELGVAIIDWYTKYGQIYLMDVNFLAAQAYQESGYNVWIYPLTSSASGISQFIVDTVYGVVIKNQFGVSNLGNNQYFSDEEIALITKNIKGDKFDYNTYTLSKLLGRQNRATLHQNIIDNPDLMIKAQFRYMKYLSKLSNGLASTTLFGYSRGQGMIVWKNHNKAIFSDSIKRAAQYSAGYEVEGIDYVYRIFKSLYYNFGYTQLNMDSPSNFDKFKAETDESNIRV